MSRQLNVRRKVCLVFMIFLPRRSHSSSRVFTEFGGVIARGIFVVILILRADSLKCQLARIFSFEVFVIFRFAISNLKCRGLLSSAECREKERQPTPRHSSV